MQLSKIISTLSMLLIGCAAAHGVDIAPGQTEFSKGIYKVSKNITFEQPVTFAEGAVLDIAAGVTVTFKGSFSAGKGQVFAGNGNVAGLHKLTPEWFGAKGDGKTDDTAAIQKALNTFKDSGIQYGGVKGCDVLLLRGTYLVKSLNADTTNLNIHSENAWLIASPEGKHPYLIRFTKQFCSITGYLSVEGNYNLGYDCVINVNSRHFRADNVIVWRAKLPWRFGNPEWAEKPSPIQVELGDSENTMSGCSTVHCIRGVELIGTESIAVFNNSLIYSYPWTLPPNDPRKAAWEAEDATLVRTIGGMVYFTGSKLCNFTPAYPIIEVQPLKNTNRQYYSKYGAAFLFNTHIEGGNFFKAANPKQIRTQSWKGVPVEQQSISLSLISCGGYVSGAAVPINTDPLFTGTIVVQNCNFYTDILGGAEYESSIFAKIGNPSAPIKVDNLSLRNNYINGLGAIVGGMALFEDRLIFDGRKSAQEIRSEGTRLVFTAPAVTTDTPHFAACYNNSTGEFTVPVGGLDNVRITAGIHYADGKWDDQSQIIVMKNAVPVHIGTITGPAGSVCVTLPRLEKGDVIRIEAKTANGKRALAPDGAMNMFQIVASRY